MHAIWMINNGMERGKENVTHVTIELEGRRHHVTW